MWPVRVINGSINVCVSFKATHDDNGNKIGMDNCRLFHIASIN